MPALPIAKKRVAIVGGGAAGCSAAYAMSLSPELFEVTLFERAAVLGGMATSTEIDPNIYGASYINDGVQGASPVFHNVFKLWELLGFSSSSVGMEVAFGKSPEEFWSNVFPTGVIDRFQPDIIKFGKVLKIIKNTEFIFFAISVEKMLSLFRFSQDFGEIIVFPLVALFFGTGNATPFVSSAILARVFNDANMRLFEYSSTSFLASIPEMKAFPRLSLIYKTWFNVIESTNCVKIKTSHEVLEIDRSSGKGAEITYRSVEGIDIGQMVVVGDGEKAIRKEFYDEIILCTDADASLKLLGKGATYLEKKILGNVKYLWDVTITHSDEEYMKKYYNLTYEESMASTETKDPNAQQQFDYARKSFQPLYFIRSYPNDKKKIEMSFDLTHYQPQFNGVSEYGRASSSSASSLSGASVDGSKKEAGGEKKKFKHVYQTIFLDRDGAKDLWTIGEINKDEIILEKWWKQQSHRVQHYRATVPWVSFLNGRNHTRFAGAWSVLNMHEIAVVSGFAAAYKLGANYPFLADDKCKRLFTLYLALSHASRMRSEDRKGFFV